MEYESLVGNWVDVYLVNGTKWTGKLEECDEEVVYISNGNDFNNSDHKGAECTQEEVKKILETDSRAFHVEMK